MQTPTSNPQKKQIQVSKKTFLPAGWKRLKLGEIASLSAGGTPSTSVSEYWEGGTVPWLSSGEVRNNIIIKSVEKITELGLASSAAKIFPKGTILMAIAGQGLTRGRTALMEIEAATNQSVVGIICKEKEVHNIFLWYFLQNEYWRLRNISQGTNRGGLNLSLLNNYDVTLPPIPEQQKIAFILSAVDDLIHKINKIIEQTRRLKKALMQTLLTKGIGHTMFKRTDLGRIPEKWQVIALKEIVSSYKNGIYKLPQYYGRGFPSIRMFNISGGIINAIDAPILEVTEQELIDFGLRVGDIIVNRVNTAELVGKTGIVKKDLGKVTFESKNIRIRVVQEKCLPEFLAHFMNTRTYFMQIRSAVKRAIGQSTINQKDLDEIKIPLPSLPEQKRIVEVISSSENELYNLEEHKDVLTALKKSLMQKLLTGQIRVKT